MQKEEMIRIMDVLEDYIGDERKVLDALRYIEGGRNDFPRKNNDSDDIKND